MFNHTLKTSSFSKRSKSQQHKYSTYFSTAKNSKKYNTPHKPHTTTLNTNNNTLSIYSIHSKNPIKTSFIQKQSKTVNEKTRHSSIPCIKSKRSNSLKSKAKSKMQKKHSKMQNKRASQSKYPKSDYQRSKQKMISNKQLYKQLRGSLNYHSTSLLLSKISEIFDLVLEKVKLPYEIQTLLYRPLQILKSHIEQRGKTQISQTLTQFKNNCLNVLKYSSSGEITLFQRMQLPKNNRWLSKPINNTTIKKEQEMQSRLASFRNLKKKKDFQNNREEEVLSRIQNRLDDFLCKSVKYRKVYL